MRVVLLRSRPPDLETFAHIFNRSNNRSESTLGERWRAAGRLKIIATCDIHSLWLTHP